MPQRVSAKERLPAARAGCRGGRASRGRERYVISLTLTRPASRHHQCTMQISRRFTLPTHGAIEFLSGMAMMLAPAILAFGALIVSVSLGAILTGMGLSLSASRPGETVAWHRDFDSVFLLTTAAAAFVLALAGQAVPAIFLSAIVATLASLSFATGYAGTT